MSDIIASIHPPIDLYRERDIDFQSEIFNDDSEPVGYSSGDVFRFKIWTADSSAPLIDIDSVADPSQTFTADSGTDVITSAAHGLTNGQRIRVTNSGGGLPGNLSEGTTYYIISATTDTFQVSLTSGGSAVNMSSNGTGTQTWHTSAIVISTLGITGTTACKVFIYLLQNDINTLTADTTYKWELSVVIASTLKIKPITRGTFNVKGNATGGEGLT